MEHLLELDLENLISMLKSDKLNLVNEATLIDLVREYMDVRDAVPKRIPVSAEEKAGPELWALLTADERLNRITVFDEAEAKRVETLSVEQGKDAHVYFAKNATDRIQHVLDIKQL